MSNIASLPAAHEEDLFIRFLYYVIAEMGVLKEFGGENEVASFNGT